MEPFIKKLKNFFSLFFFELLIICAFILTVNTYLENEKETIVGDGVGYYDYLTSIFIHNDLNRQDGPLSDPSKFERINKLPFYVKYNDSLKVNKYTAGTALLQAPFFLINHQFQKNNTKSPTGKEPSYQKTIFISTTIYLLFSLIIFKFILQYFTIKPWVIHFLQLLLVLGSSVTHYTYREPSYSHIYSLFAICLFIFSFIKFKKTKSTKWFLVFGASLGLIFIIRQINIIVVLFLPFLSGSFTEFKGIFFHLYQNYKQLITGILACISLAFIQFLIWYYQTGTWVLFSYGDEGFNFAQPFFIEFLFGFRKGLFVYTPVMFFGLLSIFFLKAEKRYFEIFSWLTAFILIIYVFSSWWAWDFGSSFGSRPMIEFYPLLLIPLGIKISQFQIGNFIFIPLLLLCIPLNTIQTYQYKHYIIHWGKMDFKKYTKTFLKTHERFSGMIWAGDTDLKQYIKVDERDLGTVKILANKNEDIGTFNCNEIDSFQNVSLIRVHNIIKKRLDTKGCMVLAIDGKELNPGPKYWHKPYFTRFNDGEDYGTSYAYYDFKFNKFGDKNYRIRIEASAGDFDQFIKDIRIEFFAKKEEIK